MDQNGEDTLVYIPVADETLQKIKDIMACDVSAVDIAIKLVEDYTYKYYGYEPNPDGKATAKDIAAMFMKFEKKVYNHRIFQVPDVELAKKILGENWQDELTHLILKEDPVTNEIGFYRTISVVVVPGVVPMPSYTDMPEIIITTAPSTNPIIFPSYPGLPIGYNGFNWWIDNNYFGTDPNGGNGATSPGSSPGSTGNPTPPGTSGGGNSNGQSNDEPGWEPPPCGGHWEGEQYIKSPCDAFANPSYSALAAMVNLNHEQLNWLQIHLDEASIIFDRLEESLADEEPSTLLAYRDHLSPEVIAATKMTIDAAMNNLLEGPYDEQHLSIISPYITQNNLPVDPMYWARFSLTCALIHIEHPEYGKFRVYLEASMEMIHGGLDLVGLVPGVGEIADLLNGAIYTLQGDGVNATLSYASAIPVAGWYAAGIKLAKKTFTITAINGSKRTLMWIVEAGGKIKFGDRGLLRKVLGLAKGDSRIAHHLIPWEHCEDLLIQKAAKGNNAFHMNEILNGIPLTVTQHDVSHALYNQKIKDKLTRLWAEYGEEAMSNETAEGLVRNLANSVRNWIFNHPNQSINDIIL